LEENVPNGNQRISLVEMDEISLYESINENQVLSDLSGRRTDKTALKEVRLPTTNSRTFQGKITL
jgi:hypothetical protein